MPDFERIRQAFLETGDFQENPAEIGQEIEAWVAAIIEGVRRGYSATMIVTEEEASIFMEAGQVIHPGEADVRQHNISEDPSSASDATLRDYALGRLEEAAARGTLVDPFADLIWLRYNAQANRWEGEFAFDVLEEEGSQ